MTPTRKRLPLLASFTAVLLVLASCDATTDTGEPTPLPTTAPESSPATSPTAPATTTAQDHTEDLLDGEGLGASTTVTVPEDAGMEMPETDNGHRVTVADGEVVGGVVTIETEVGSIVHIVVTTDTPDHVHVHGYDIFFDTVAGVPTDVMFTADIPGIFEIELEDIHLEIAQLEVR